ncbi:MAG: hypothetical protein QM726_23315 [Chitinophagaceae bacterium]
MDFDFYLNKFNDAIAALNKQQFALAGIELHAGIILNSVALKAYKISWASDQTKPITSTSRIFFSIWVSDASLSQNKLLYNIHALKLRQFTGYKITSRDFAEKFRKKFAAYKKDWPNISLDYGPLTLMEGWVELNMRTLENDIRSLLQKFIAMHSIIDGLLDSYKV